MDSIFKYLQKNISLKTFKKFNTLLCESGQAATEYILIMVIAVGIIIGVVSQFNTSFGKYMNDYFGEYLSCLLEAGELPQLGSEEANLSNICEAEFKPFQLTPLPGRPAKNQNSSASDSRRTANTRGIDKGGSNSNSSFRSGGSSSGGGGSGKSGSSGGFSNFGTSSSFNSAKNKTMKASDKEKNSLGDESSGSNNVQGFSYANGKRKSLQDTNESFAAGSSKNKKKKDKTDEKTLSPDKEKNSENAQRKSKIKVKPPRKPSSEIDLGEPLQFGDYLRYIIIAALILAVLLLVGGQALQISKSKE